MDTFGIGDAVKRKKKVYVESSIISYLTARDSHDVSVYAKQLATREWWNIRSRFELYISTLIMKEISFGDTEAARLRENAVTDITVLKNTQEAYDIADKLVDCNAVPAKARADATHIATASVHGMDFLVTWNQAHITNPTKRAAIEAVIMKAGVRPPLLVKPDDLLEINHAD